jgi:hypothetical protein
MNGIVSETIGTAVTFTLLCSSPVVWGQSRPFSVRPATPPIQTTPDVPAVEEDPVVQRGTPPTPDKSLSLPKVSEVDLPPGIIVSPAYCPQGYEEIPNGAELYQVKPVEIPGFNPTPLHVCREIEPTAK